MSRPTLSRPLRPVYALLSLLALGLAFGVRHAFDADHVVAVTAIVARHRSAARAASVGILWGIGHTATICAVGGAIVLLQLVISPRVGLGMEFTVAVMLIGLGLWNLLVRPERDVAPSPSRPVLIGMVHGLAGSAAVALLVVGAVDRPGWAMAYLAVFGGGTVIGMLLVTMALALPAAWAANHDAWRWERPLRLAAGTLSVVFGLVLAHDVGIAQGLFTADPQWHPR